MASLGYLRPATGYGLSRVLEAAVPEKYYLSHGRVLEILEEDKRRRSGSTRPPAAQPTLSPGQKTP